jgi:uncharacterized membrane protein YphA (DoxX/SURF4 family)
MKTKNTIAWVLQVLLGIFFIFNGVMKWSAIGDMIKSFAEMGYPAWLFYVVATFELV